MKTITFDPATHVLVPREPTEAMISATLSNHRHPERWTDERAKAYRAAIAAAPDAEVAQPSAERAVTLEAERESFEAWALANHTSLNGVSIVKRDGADGYANRLIGSEWRCWQARAAADRATASEIGRDAWISVKKRLPQEGQTVLAFWKPSAGGPAGGHFYATATYSAGLAGWHNPEDDEDSFAIPTLWMPLPSIDAAMRAEAGERA